MKVCHCKTYLIPWTSWMEQYILQVPLFDLILLWYQTNDLKKRKKNVLPCVQWIPYPSRQKQIPFCFCTVNPRTDSWIVSFIMWLVILFICKSFGLVTVIQKLEFKTCFLYNYYRFVVPEEFCFDPTTRQYGDPSKRPEVRTATVEFIAPSEYMVSR